MTKRVLGPIVALLIAWLSASAASAADKPSIAVYPPVLNGVQLTVDVRSRTIARLRAVTGGRVEALAYPATVSPDNAERDLAEFAKLNGFDRYLVITLNRGSDAVALALNDATNAKPLGALTTQMQAVAADPSFDVTGLLPPDSATAAPAPAPAPAPVPVAVAPVAPAPAPVAVAPAAPAPAPVAPAPAPVAVAPAAPQPVPVAPAPAPVAVAPAVAPAPAAPAAVAPAPVAPAPAAAATAPVAPAPAAADAPQERTIASAVVAAPVGGAAAVAPAPAAAPEASARGISGAFRGLGNLFARKSPGDAQHMNLVLIPFERDGSDPQATHASTDFVAEFQSLGVTVKVFHSADTSAGMYNTICQLTQSDAVVTGTAKAGPTGPASSFEVAVHPCDPAKYLSPPAYAQQLRLRFENTITNNPSADPIVNAVRRLIRGMLADQA